MSGRFASLHVVQASRLIESRRHPKMAGVYDAATGNGRAIVKIGRRSGWRWERTITHGQWAGTWRRVKDTPADIQAAILQFRTVVA